MSNEDLGRYVRQIGYYFASGLVILVPLIITLILLGWVLDFVNSFLGPWSFLSDIVNTLLALTFMPSEWKMFVGYTLILVLIVLLGIFKEKNDLGKKVSNTIEWTFHRIPIINKVYAIAGQLSDYFLKPSEGLSKFADVVTFEMWNGRMFGLIAPNSVIEIDDTDFVWVYVPTAPVPATGVNYMVQVDKVYICDNIGIDSFVKANISLGILAQDMARDGLSVKPYRMVLNEQKEKLRKKQEEEAKDTKKEA